MVITTILLSQVLSSLTSLSEEQIASLSTAIKMKLGHKQVFPIAIEEAREQQKLEKELAKIEREKTLEEAREGQKLAQAKARSKRQQQVDTDEKSNLVAKPDGHANTAPALPDGFKFHYFAS